MIHSLRIFFTVFSFLLINNSYSQKKSEIDSLKYLVQTSKKDSIIMEAYNRLRRITYYSQPKESKKYALLNLDYAKKINNPDKIAVAHYHIGNAMVTHAEFGSAINHYLKAAEFYEKEGDSLRLSSVFNGIGAAYENNGNDTLSLKYFTMSYDISRKRGDSRRSGIAANNISNIYKNRGELTKTIEYLERATVYLKNPKYKQYYIPISINLANAYADAKKYDKSAVIYKKMLKSVDSINDIYSYAAALRGLGNLELQKGNDEKALEFLKNAFDKYTKSGFVDERYDTMKDLIDAYQTMGYNKEALLLFYEYNTIKDSIFTTEKDKNLTEALQKYEASKKEKKIIAQQLQIEKKNKQKQLLSFGLLFLVILSVLGTVFYKKRLRYQKKIADQTKKLQYQKITELKQENKLIAFGSVIEGQEAERLRIAKDLHDSLGGMLSTIKSHFSTLQQKNDLIRKIPLSEKTNLLIDEACLEVRRISHNMMPNALNISGLEGALEDLGEYLSEQGYITKVEISNLKKSLSDTSKIMIYRLVQEIISNIRKHAKATHILIQLIGYQNEIILTIEDDGVGFDYDKALVKKSLGLKSINSRVSFLNGTIYWDSQIRRGTEVIINIPVK